MTQLLTDQLRLMAEHFGDEAGFADLGQETSLSFAVWDARSSALSRGLAAAGVASGDRVAIHLSVASPLDWVVAYAAIHKAGAVAVPVNTRWVTAELAEILAHAEVSAAFTDDDGWDILSGTLSRVGTLRLIVVRDRRAERRAPAGVDVRGWDDLVSNDGSPFQNPVDDDAMADIVYTSGTTGRPKGVVVRHRNASLIPNGLPVWTGSGWIFSSPLFTFAGITAIYNPMKLGLRALYLPRFDTAAWIAAVERERPSMAFLVPAMAELLLADPRFEAADLSSVGLCAVGGAPLAPRTQRRLQAAMPAASVSNGYGMTEAGPAYTVLPKEEAERRVGSVGKAIPPAEFVVVGEDGSRLPPGAVGELVINNPGRQREYYRDPAATARTWHGDGLHTGDLARLDDDGYLYIVGRLKDLIIRGGNNIYAGDVEAVLYEHPAVVEAAVAGVAHEVLGEDVAAWVVLRPETAVTPEELMAWASERLADYKVPRRITLVTSLPRNATGKVVKDALTQSQPQPPPPLDG
ncbi:MAG TPA: AMP-binding protein [Acidimicrobiales bacterium]|nr:AMP-binding protein [Acidimicrobiales bacterium]